MKRNVLIVNAGSMYSDNATGITLRSIFQKLDNAKCLEVSWYGDVKNVVSEIQIVRPHYGRFSVANVLLRYKRGNVNKAIKASAVLPQKVTLQRKILTFLRQYLALLPDQCRLYFSREDIERINHFSPDVIYTLGGSVNALRVSYELSRRYSIPIVVHHMDNWLHCIQWEDNFLLNAYKKRLRELCHRCYERTTQCIAISDGMAEEFTQETGVNHVAIMNSIDCNALHFGRVEHAGFRFVYAGGMHLERYKALLDFAEEVEAYNRKTGGRKTEFAIYTGEDNISAFGDFFRPFQSTKLYSAVPHNQIGEIYENADALVHVESATVLNSDFFKYSISTKIPEYLSTGRPVIFYGPDTLYLYKFLQENGIASVAKEKEKLIDLISLFVEQPNLTQNMTIQAQRYAKEHFEINNAAEILVSVLEGVELPNKEKN